MKLYDCAANSLEIERFILSQTELFRTPHDALAAIGDDEHLYEITIEVREIK